MSYGNESMDAEHPPLRRNTDFLRYFFGTFVSNAGDSLYAVATLWLVFDLSGSTFLTGVASSLLLLPYLLQIVAGPVVDRLPLKAVLVGSQVVQGVVVLVFPLTAYTGHLTVWLILVTIPALAMMTLVTSPVQAALVPRIVADEQLSRSNSALATVTLGLDMLFDALGGLFIAVFGVTTLFLLDSITFAVASVLFLGMTVPSVDGGGEPAPESPLTTYVDDLRAGIDRLRGTLFVPLLLTSAVVNFAVGVTLAILPAFGDSLGGPALYGLLLGALGVGRLLGSIAAPFFSRVAYGRFVVIAFSLAALCWASSVAVSSPALTLVLFGLAWIPSGINGVLTETLNQRVFPKPVLGRIAAIKGTAATATLPLGSLVGGLVAGSLGVATTMGLAAFGFGFVAGYVAIRPSLRTLPSVTDSTAADYGVTVSDENIG
ncbi:MFS transporter [Halovivax gelatinilyticus]|uniref:MFS transporter n=1 Tax=Halovivax gelatinilyticus TaxID=2961597 RepID=UPI0020CA5595|nr:MFS transporter [Halovivax gelatinilyticus]